MSWDRLAELVKDDTVLSSFVESNKGRVEELSQANKQMAEAIEGKDRAIKEQGDERKQLREKVTELEEQVKNTPSGSEEFQKQIQQIKSDYESKLAENASIVDSLKKENLENLRSLEFARLNLAAKLPYMEEGEYAEAMEFFNFQLSRGLEYSEEHKAFVYMDGGVPKINPDTAKPLTVAEMAKEKIESGAWNKFLAGNPTSGPQRGNVQSPATQQTSVKMDSTDLINKGLGAK